MKGEKNIFIIILLIRIVLFNTLRDNPLNEHACDIVRTLLHYY